jgi:hypothetical protein
MEIGMTNGSPTRTYAPSDYPGYKGPRTSILVRLEVGICERIKRAAVGKDQTVNDWISAQLDLAATGQNNSRSLGKRSANPGKQVDLVEHLNEIASAPNPAPLGPSRRRVRAA